MVFLLKSLGANDLLGWWSVSLGNNVPIFSPAITDGSIGDMLYFHSYKRAGHDVGTEVVEVFWVKTKDRCTDHLAVLKFMIFDLFLEMLSDAAPRLRAWFGTGHSRRQRSGETICGGNFSGCQKLDLWISQMWEVDRDMNTSMFWTGTRWLTRVFLDRSLSGHEGSQDRCTGGRLGCKQTYCFFCFMDLQTFHQQVDSHWFAFAAQLLRWRFGQAPLHECQSHASPGFAVEERSKTPGFAYWLRRILTAERWENCFWQRLSGLLSRTLIAFHSAGPEISGRANASIRWVKNLRSSGSQNDKHESWRFFLLSLDLVWIPTVMPCCACILVFWAICCELTKTRISMKLFDTDACKKPSVVSYPHFSGWLF